MYNRYSLQFSGRMIILHRNYFFHLALHNNMTCKALVDIIVNFGAVITIHVFENVEHSNAMIL